MHLFSFTKVKAFFKTEIHYKIIHIKILYEIMEIKDSARWEWLHVPSLPQLKSTDVHQMLHTNLILESIVSLAGGKKTGCHTQWRTGEVASLPDGKWAP
ncbi:hypothetical protein AVEN_96604-1 [Araneus ventricosus]|uniref:Uncharacterized protein n=1 Tax=Araneus ventricosus TaxID=182803 RepID=A0A4Y2KYG3_ARAVE|nr:hypothetical protein AVEN_96604-1 [Araneus ventricosus]